MEYKYLLVYSTNNTLHNKRYVSKESSIENFIDSILDDFKYQVDFVVINVIRLN